MNRDEKDYLFVFILIAIIFLLASLADTCYGQEFLQWRWSHEPILKNPDASGLHCIGGIVFTILFGLMSRNLIIGAICSAIFWFLWEIKDGLIKWEDGYCTGWPIHYNWGGDGLSYKDMLVAWIGAILILLIW